MEPWQRWVLSHENTYLLRGYFAETAVSIGLNVILERGKLDS
jgi:hypothetical protein